MTKFKDGFSSKSYYPDSNYYLEQENTPKEDPLSEDQTSNRGMDLNGQILIGLLRKEPMEGSQ